MIDAHAYSNTDFCCFISSSKKLFIPSGYSNTKNRLSKAKLRLKQHLKGCYHSIKGLYNRMSQHIQSSS